MSFLRTVLIFAVAALLGAAAVACDSAASSDSANACQAA